MEARTSGVAEGSVESYTERTTVDGSPDSALALQPAQRRRRERLAWSALEYPIAPSANRLPYMLGGLTFFGL